MKFTVSRENLLPSLQTIIGVIERKQTLPILSNILLKMTNDQLVLTGTDLEIQLVTRTAVDPVDQGGEITTPARKLMDICRLLPEQSQLSIDLKDEKLYLRSGRSRFTLSTLPAGNYPEFSSKEYDTEFRIDEVKFKKILGKTYFCMALQDVRHFLNGLLFEIENDRLQAVASDGHRMAMYSETLSDVVGASKRVIIPRKSIMELYRLLDESERPITVQIASNSLCVRGGDIVFSTKLLEGKYPDYKGSIPTSVTKVIGIGKQLFREALSRAAILSNETFKGIRLDIASGLMKISANNPAQEAAEEEVEINYDGEPFFVGFNVSYLLDAVSNIDSDEVSLSFTDSHTCCVVEDPMDDNLKFIVMPVHL
jgi:DNA polymerase III subunit beta